MARREAESRGVEPPDPSWAARLAGGHLAPMQDGLSRSVGEVGIEPTSSRSRTARAASAPHPDTAEGEGVEPPRLIARPFSRRVPSPHWLVLPRTTSRVLGQVVGRVGIEPTSNGLRDRCNASVCYRPMAPPPGVEPGPSAFRADAQTSYARVGSENGSDPFSGCLGSTPRPQLLNCQLAVPDMEFRTQESNPDLAVQSRASFHWTSPDRRLRTPGAAIPFERMDRSRVGHQGVEPRGPLWTTRLQRAPASLPV